MTLATMLSDWLEKKFLNSNRLVPSLIAFAVGIGVLKVASMFGLNIHIGSVVLGIFMLAVVNGVFHIGIKVWADDGK